MSKDITKNNELLFDGSLWCNLDVALRTTDQYFRQYIRPAELTVIEWYILRSLYEVDGQHASALARAVGRAATSFTPNLDKLQTKGYVERQADPHDRRAVRIFLTQKGQDVREDVLESANELDRLMAEMFDSKEFNAFTNVLNRLQSLNYGKDN
jgi:DNA-binding MarR family transcriptional regulator